MKKILLFIVLICAIYASAQETTTSEHTLATNTCPSLDIIGGKYYLDNNLLTTKEYKDFLKNNSPAAWNQYRQGNALWGAGWAMFAVGLYTAGLGGIILAPSLVVSWFTNDGDEPVYLGTGLLVGGVALASAGIPCFVVGKWKKDHAHNIYNEECRQATNLELSLQTSSNGIGLALRF